MGIRNPPPTSPRPSPPPAPVSKNAIHDAPTPEELESHPSLKHAWEEYLLIRKLVIPDNQINPITTTDPYDLYID